MDVFRAYWREKYLPDTAPDTVGFVKAVDEADAKRIMEENLDTRRYKVTFVSKAAWHMVTPQSITVNFQNTAEYSFGW